MKPGQTNLLNYLLGKEENKADLNEIEKIFRIKKSIVEKWSKVYPKHFSVVDNYVLIPKEENISVKEDRNFIVDNEAYRVQRETIVNDLRQMLVGPCEESDNLDKNDVPMSKYLCGKLIPIGISLILKELYLRPLNSTPFHGLCARTYICRREDEFRKIFLSEYNRVYHCKLYRFFVASIIHI